MKKEIKLNPNGFYLLGIISTLLGTSLAIFLYYEYSAVARGLLGLIAVFLTIQYGKQLKVTGTLDELFARPKIYKTFVYIFVLSIITSWTVQEVFKVIFFFFDR